MACAGSDTSVKSGLSTGGSAQLPVCTSKGTHRLQHREWILKERCAGCRHSATLCRGAAGGGGWLGVVMDQ